MFQKMTAQEYREKHNGEKAQLETAQGSVEIVGIDKNYWAYAPKENAGFGRSYCLHAGSQIELA